METTTQIECTKGQPKNKTRIYSRDQSSMKLVIIQSVVHLSVYEWPLNMHKQTCILIQKEREK